MIPQIVLAIDMKKMIPQIVLAYVKNVHHLRKNRAVSFGTMTAAFQHFFKFIFKATLSCLFESYY